MPTPSSNESYDDWMERCVPELIDEGYESDQAAAICNSKWEEKASSLQKLYKKLNLK